MQMKLIGSDEKTLMWVIEKIIDVIQFLSSQCLVFLRPSKNLYEHIKIMETFSKLLKW